MAGNVNPQGRVCASCGNIVHHPQEAEIAAIFAVVFAVIVGVILLVLSELLPISSHIHGAIREFLNKRAEQSAGRIRKRIEDLEKYRQSAAAYLTSDKAHYLSTLRFILAVLAFMALGASILIAEHMELLARFIIPGSFDLLALFCFGVAITMGVYAVRIASLDTQAQIVKMLEGIDADIEKLKAQLFTNTD
jgi:hypothetical protein